MQIVMQREGFWGEGGEEGGEKEIQKGKRNALA